MTLVKGMEPDKLKTSPPKTTPVNTGTPKATTTPKLIAPIEIVTLPSDLG